MYKVCLWIGIIWIVCNGCSIIRETPKYQFINGLYASKVFDTITKKVYVQNQEDAIYLYPVIKTKNKLKIDTTNLTKIALPNEALIKPPYNSYFRQTSFDIDFLTLPFKYRPRASDFPRQFNTNLNGAVYLGYRSDVYHIRYKETLLENFTRQTRHYGFSFGAFTGLGGTAMNPWVTGNQLTSEYDGIIWSKGIAAIMGLNNFSAGLAFGFDNLLDRNKRYWIYQKKPWIGFVFSLNIN